MGLRRDNHAVSRRQRIDGYHSQTRHTVDQHKVVIPFDLIHIGFQDTLTTQGIDQPYLQTRQLNVGRDKVNAFLVMDNPLRDINCFIVDDVLHHGGEGKGQVVRTVISQRHCKVCLRIGVDEQHLFPLLCQSHAQIDRCGGLADTAFLVCQSNHFAV